MALQCYAVYDTRIEHNMTVTEQLPTGVPGLDQLLRGGLRRSGLHAIVGKPGTGKSVLAHQIGAHHVRGGGRVLYLTALVEVHQTLVSQARTFRFFDPASVASTFYYESLYAALERGGLKGVREEVVRLLQERDVSLLVFDGLRALQYRARSPYEYQQLIHGLEGLGAMIGVTTLLLTHPRRTASADPTLTVADAILALRTKPVALRSVSMISVVKLRGVGHLKGWHTFAITEGGVRVYPRLEAVVAADGLPPHVPAVRKLDFAVQGLGTMLDGGVPSSSVTLAVGTPGAGKTILGLAFLSAGAKANELGLYVGFHETPDRLVSKAEGLGLPLRKAVEAGRVQFQWQPPSELLSDALAERILAAVVANKAQRLVLDSLDDLWRGALPGGRELAFLSAFFDLLRAQGLGVFVTQDLARLAGPHVDLPLGEVSAIVDNLLHLRAVELRSELRRLVAVFKTREARHDYAVRELHIEHGTLRVGDTFKEGGALLTGLAQVGSPDAL